MKKTNDYKNFDYLTLYVKKKKVDEIKKHYKLLKWDILEEVENKKYEDIVDLTFFRSHKIDNKDKLQLSQVYLEEKLNEIGKLERHKHSQSLIFGLNFFIFILSLIFLGVSFCLKHSILWKLILGICLLYISVLLLVGGIVVLNKIYKREKERFSLKEKVIQQDIEKILNNALTFIGGVDE